MYLIVRGTTLSACIRNNVHVRGVGEQAIVFAHGYGCDQHMWRHVVAAFEAKFRTVLFDLVGAGGSDLKAYSPERYATLSGHADDLIEILTELSLQDVVFVGHSVSATIGMLASIKAPKLFKCLVLVGPSPCYIDDGDYNGGFSAAQIDELLEFLSSNHMGWSAAMAPAIMGNPDRPALGDELSASFCRMDPTIAKEFARVTFKTDHRADLSKVTRPTLILQCSDDIIAPTFVGKYMHQHIENSTLVQLSATGHCPNLSAPAEVISAIRAYV